MQFEILYPKQDLSDILELSSIGECVAYILRTHSSNSLADNDVFYINNTKYYYDAEAHYLFLDI